MSNLPFFLLGWNVIIFHQMQYSTTPSWLSVSHHLQFYLVIFFHLSASWLQRSTFLHFPSCPSHMSHFFLLPSLTCWSRSSSYHIKHYVNMILQETAGIQQKMFINTRGERIQHPKNWRVDKQEPGWTRTRTKQHEEKNSEKRQRKARIKGKTTQYIDLEADKTFAKHQRRPGQYKTKTDLPSKIGSKVNSNRTGQN